MQLDILTPEKRLFSGQVEVVTLPGENGSLQVLKDHAPLISALGKGTLEFQIAPSTDLATIHPILRKGTGNARFTATISGGFVEVLANKVTVLVESLS